MLSQDSFSELLLHSLPQIVIRLDSSGHILYHNQNLAEIVSAGIDDAVGDLLLQHLHAWSAADSSDLKQFLSLPLAAGEKQRVTYALSLKTCWASRGIFRAELRPVLQTTAGQKDSDYLLILEDVTSLRQMEEEYRRVQRIQALLPLIRGFGSDFIERLTIIYGTVDYLLGELKDDGVAAVIPGSAEISDGLSTIVKHLQRSNALLDNILWKSSGSKSDQGEISVVDLLREIGSQSILGSNKNLDVISGDDLPLLRGDQEKIMQLFQNVFMNAVQAGSDAYTITASVEKVDRGSGDSLLISIADHGDGMAVDVLSRAEQPFFTTKENADGLGLFIAKNIVLEHDGSIDLESVPGKGSRVHMYLPVEHSESSVSSIRKIPEGLKILILDDNPEIQEVWERLLYQLGLHGSFVRSTSQVYEKFERALESDHPFHMVILEDNDSDIPDVFQLLTRLRKLHKQLPVVYCKNSITNISLDVIREKGFSAYLRKPFRLPELQNALIKALH